MFGECSRCSGSRCLLLLLHVSTWSVPSGKHVHNSETGLCCLLNWLPVRGPKSDRRNGLISHCFGCYRSVSILAWDIMRSRFLHTFRLNLSDKVFINWSWLTLRVKIIIIQYHNRNVILHGEKCIQKKTGQCFHGVKWLQLKPWIMGFNT